MFVPLLDQEIIATKHTKKCVPKDASEKDVDESPSLVIFDNDSWFLVKTYVTGTRPRVRVALLANILRIDMIAYRMKVSTNKDYIPKKDI